MCSTCSTTECFCMDWQNKLLGYLQQLQPVQAKLLVQSAADQLMHDRRPDQQVSSSVSRNLQSQQQQDSSSKTCAGSAAAHQQQLYRVSLSSGYKLSVDLEHRSCYVSGSNLSFLNFY